MAEHVPCGVRTRSLHSVFIDVMFWISKHLLHALPSLSHLFITTLDGTCSAGGWAETEDKLLAIVTQL